MTFYNQLLAGAATLTLTVGAANAGELTFGMQDNEVSNVYQGALAFKERLETLSDGEMTVNLFPNASLGDFKAMVSQVQVGELDMVLTGYPDMSYIIPELKLVDNVRLNLAIEALATTPPIMGMRKPMRLVASRMA